MTEQLAVSQETRMLDCEAHGQYEAKVMILLGKEHISSCPECCEEEDKRRAVQESARAHHVAGELAKRILPQRFHGCDFDGYKVESDGQRRALAICKKYASRWDDRKAKGGCLVLCGNPGTGKTHLAAAIVKAILPHEIDGKSHYDPKQPVIYTTATAMTRKIKATYDRDSQESEDEVIRHLSSIGLLLIDEVGAQRGTETELLLIQEVIDGRYQRVLPTILISNLQESELSEYIGERALDRLYDNGGAVVGFDWGSKRRG